jgi:hypothetical protein
MPLPGARTAGAVALVALLAAGTGCAERAGPEALGGAAGTAPAAEEPPAAVDPVDLKRLRLGPASPVPGEAYPFDLYTHCGLGFARFGGRTWRAERPAPEPRPLPGAGGRTRYTGYTAGTMTLVEEGTARFVIDKSRYEVPGSPVVIFHPTTTQPPTCA